MLRAFVPLGRQPLLLKSTWASTGADGAKFFSGPRAPPGSTQHAL